MDLEYLKISAYLFKQFLDLANEVMHSLFSITSIQLWKNSLVVDDNSPNLCTNLSLICAIRVQLQV